MLRMRTLRFLMALSGALALMSSVEGAPTPKSAAIQILQHLGLDRGASIPNVVPGERIRQGDSPIYYIKLPPIPYYYVNNLYQPSTYTTPFPFEKVAVDFTSNGRPDQVYHWNQYATDAPPSQYWPFSTTPAPSYWQQPSTTPAPITTTTTTPIPTTTTQKPTKKPWLTIDKYFPYNGKPSGIYIYKPKPAINVNKYKQQYFTHFNY